MVVSFVDFFRQLCQNNNWNFDYGTKSYHNLRDSDNAHNKEYFLFLDPIVTLPERGEMSINSVKYQGAFLLGVKSEFGNQSYDNDSGTVNDGKFKTNIQPLYEKYYSTINNRFLCNDYEVVSEKITEVIDRYDLNIDGIFVEFTLRVGR